MLNLTQRLKGLVALGLGVACLGCGLVDHGSTRSMREAQSADQLGQNPAPSPARIPDDLNDEVIGEVKDVVPGPPLDHAVVPSPSSHPMPGIRPLGGVSFDLDVKPFIIAKCSECHHAGSRLTNLTAFPFNEGDMDVYVDLVMMMANPGATPRMPPGPRAKLTAAEYQRLVQWKADGLQP